MLFEILSQARYFPSPSRCAGFYSFLRPLLLGFALCPIFAQQKSPERPFLFWLMIVVTVILELYGGASKTPHL